MSGVTKRGALHALGAVALLTLGFGAVVLVDRRGRSDQAATAAASCPHRLTANACPFCDPGRVERLGPCGEHGVPEALCSRCNADLIPAFKLQGDWCGAHGVPESQCVICDPSRAPAVVAGSAPPPAVTLRTVEVETPRRGRAPSTTCATETLRVQFLSAQVAQDAGLAYATIAQRPVPLALTCVAQVEYDKNRYAHVAPRAPGVVRSVARDLGDRVEAGGLLAVVTSTELGDAKADLLEARALVGLWEQNAEREQRLLARRVATEREALHASTELAKSRVDHARARQRLRNLGLSAGAIARVASEQDTSSELAVRAPLSGTVVARDAVAGEVVRTDRPLFAVADTRTLWALFDVREGDVRQVRVGQPVVLSVSGLRGETFPGRVSWVSAELNRRTRTLQARAEVKNVSGVLRAGMFGRAVVQVSGTAPRVLVPKAAVQWEGCCNVVFVRVNERLFLPRKVRLGPDAGERWVVEEGLRAGETVVTTGSFLLKTEILKGSIGAGCCEVSPAR